LDVRAALLRNAEEDTDHLFDGLGAKLDRILGGRGRVDYEGGRLRKSHRVRLIEVEVPGGRLVATRERGAPVFRVAQVVRGIAVKTDEVTLGEWMDRLVGVLGQEFGRRDEDRLELSRLLDS